MDNLVATISNFFSRSFLSTGIDSSSLCYFYQMHFRAAENATKDSNPSKLQTQCLQYTACCFPKLDKPHTLWAKLCPWMSMPDSHCCQCGCHRNLWETSLCIQRGIWPKIYCAHIPCYLDISHVCLTHSLFCQDKINTFKDVLQKKRKYKRPLVLHCFVCVSDCN